MDETLNSEPNHQQASRVLPPIRWWPALVILAAAGIAWVWVWSVNDWNHQRRNMQCAYVVQGALVLLLVWVMAFSRLSWRARVTVLGGFLGTIMILVALLRIRGVTGDLLPILEGRWKSKPPLLITNQPPQPAIRQESILPLAGDYPQFLGPNRNAAVDGPALARDWTIQPPERLWLQPVGAAWSGFAVVSPYAITQEQRGEQEMVICYHVATGRILWSHADRARFQSSLAGEGPRATPAIVSNRVYTLGATGWLNCLELTTGKKIWGKNIVEDNQSQVAEWGMSGSPLVVDNQVVVCAGGQGDRSLVAYAKETGVRLWGAGKDKAHYSSPLLAELGGTRQMLIFNASGVSAHRSGTGEILWQRSWPGGHPHVAMPLVLPHDRVLVTSGYGTGSELWQIVQETSGAWSVKRLWKSNRLKAKFTNVVFHQDHIYGLDDGILVCLEAATGQQKWKAGRYGHGQVILVKDLLLVMAENGEVVLLEPVPQEPRELTRFTALQDKTWNPPALAGAYLIVRNDKEAACFRLRVFTR